MFIFKNKSMMMKKNLTAILFLTVLKSMIFGQTTEADYKKASSCMGYKLEKLIYNAYVNAVESDSTKQFTYLVNTKKGKQFFIIDPIKKSKSLAFDHEELAQQLSLKFAKKYTSTNLPFSQIKLNKELSSIKFVVDDSTWNFNLKSKIISNVSVKSYDSDTTLRSPDNKQILILENHNLFLFDPASKSKTALTTDGTEKKGYGSAYNWYFFKDDFLNERYDYDLEAYWSPDSKKIIVPVFDRSKTQYMHAMKWVPEKGLLPHPISYERAMPGDTNLTTSTYIVFDIDTKKMTPINIKASPEFLGTSFYWSPDSKLAYKINYDRGYTGRNLLEVNPVTGNTKMLLNETPETSVDVVVEYFQAFNKSKEFIWRSEQDGWSHLYLYDLNTGKLKNQITKGEYVVRSVQYVDEKNRKIYFMAGGKEENFDPYYKLLYVINFDGSGLKLLTPENGDHNITFINDYCQFVDNYSRVDLPNIAQLKNTNTGSIIMPLEKADISDLEAMGWKAPESFKIKGRDGKTDIYGVIYRPFNFDPTKSYPIIDGTYSGPHTIRSAKTFRKGLVNDDLPLAQLGFIVVTIDGFGSAFRSKAFHDASWKNLGDIGSIDHIKAIKEMAKKYSYMDTTRVGIYGHSAGGYDAVRALIIHPEFYKVAVSSAGCHDLRLDKVWWPEHHLGFPNDKLYVEQSNIDNASKIKGKLLLVHGDIDDNVNPVETMRLVSELIKFNKEFDLLIIPNQDHYTMYNDKYFIRKRWDYFVKNLTNSIPPPEFKID
jgi:dipeptidyl-peptidase-4